MGAWKLALPFGSGTLLSTVVASARRAGCRVVLVIGNRADAVAAALFPEGARPERADLPPVERVSNPDWALGLMGSLQAGMARVRTDFFFVLHADMPFVPPWAWTTLEREARAREVAGLPDSPIFPSFRGRTGHPVLVPSGLIPAALSLSKDGRFKDFLNGFSPVQVAVNIPAYGWIWTPARITTAPCRRVFVDRTARILYSHESCRNRGLYEKKTHIPDHSGGPGSARRGRSGVCPGMPASVILAAGP
jgi:molybdenum cofactor cytidylyltransferase